MRARVSRRLQRVEGAQRIVLEIGTRVRHRRGDRRLAGQVHDDVSALDRRNQCIVIPRVTHNQSERRVTVLLTQPSHVRLRPPARHIVVHRHLRAPAQQSVNVVAADETSPTGDQVSSRHSTSSAPASPEAEPWTEA
jgi:hypothetical protein